LDFEFKDKYNIEDMLNIMVILRSPQGCPWDKEQTHKSIRSCFIEETYEAVEAIDTDNSELLQEELGDVLLQVLFHSQLESEKGSFDFSDVVNNCVNNQHFCFPPTKKRSARTPLKLFWLIRIAVFRKTTALGFYTFFKI
jgi:uncharacterized protein YabN with tetrapyrrole methylase and pyrophosphatase domain